MFISCHPVLSTEARIALTLRLLGGLTTEEIARAFLARGADDREADRAGQADAGRQARVPFEVPPVPSGRRRLASVLEVLYLVFNEGYSAMAGDDWMRPALCERSAAPRPRAGRTDAGRTRGTRPGRADGDPGVAAGGPARSDGLPVPLLEQNRGRWDQLLIRRGFTALLRAEQLGGAAGPVRAAGGDRGLPRPGRGRRLRPTGSRSRCCTRRSALLAPSPVVELNRAVAVAMAFGPERGLEVVDGLAAEPALAGYHHLPSVRGDLLARLGRDGEAAEEFRRAAALTRNIPERTVLLRRAAECDARG